MAKSISRLCLALVALVFVSPLASAERRVSFRSDQSLAEVETVEMFSAIESGQIEVKLIPKDSTETKIFIKNNTKQPLNVKLPEAFVGVLAQPGGIGGIGGGGGGLGGGGNQGFGGGGNQGGGGFFNNIPAEKVGEMKVPVVCLEHGKRDPNPKIKYEIKPVESFSSDPQLKSLLTVMNSGKYSQPAAQAAAWHIANKMSWEELAAKRIKVLRGQDKPYFSQPELYAALHMFKTAEELAEGAKASSPGELAE